MALNVIHHRNGSVNPTTSPGAGTYRPSSVVATCERAGGPAGDSDAGAERPADAVLTTATWTVRLALDGGARVGWDPDERVAVVLHGEVHDDAGETAEALAARYRAEGDGLFRSLNGSYALLIVDRDQDRVVAVTDRVASRRLFWSRRGRTHWISSDLAGQPTDGRDLDAVAVAWVLASGACYHGRTPYEGVRVLGNGCAHELLEAGVGSIEYWSSLIQEQSAPAAPEVLAGELAELLVPAVRRRVSGPDDLFFSLSGGLDSTGIAVILAEVLGVREMRTFSYIVGEAHGKENDLARDDGEKDAFVAARTAETLGFSHEVVDSYEGDLLAHMRLNAALSEGVCHPASEITMWSGLARAFATASDPVLLVGDEYFGTSEVDPRKSMADVWRYLVFNGFALPDAVRGRISSAVLRAMQEGLDADRHEIEARVAGSRDLNRVQDQMNFQHRKMNVIFPWRERYAARHVNVRAPWLDSAVLDWAVSRGAPGRPGKQAFKDALGVLSTGFMRDFQRAHRDAYHPQRSALIRSAAPELRSWLSGSSSRLDELIPPDFGGALLESIVDPGGVPWTAARARSALGRRVASLVPGLGARRRPIHSATLFYRWAILRMALGG